MAKIENPKNYTGRDLETIFFRPMLSGSDAVDLGIKILYNTPVPTTLQFWKRAGDILQKYTASGWNGGESATKFQKQIQLSKVKAEVGYSADDYFNMVYETIAGRSDVNLDDLSGTELEAAETSLFREAVAESIRATMWLGDTERNGQLATFDGFVKRLLADSGPGENDVPCFYLPENFAGNSETDAAEKVFKKLWEDAPEVLKAFKPQGNLVYLVTSDIYARYEEELDNVVLESAYLAKQNGREALSYRGIPVIDIQVTPYLKTCGDMPQTFALLTDRRNLAIAVNTADFPGTEIRMWYNPDQMENRQRAIFMAGCDYLLLGRHRRFGRSGQHHRKRIPRREQPNGAGTRKRRQPGRRSRPADRGTGRFRRNADRKRYCQNPLHRHLPQRGERRIHHPVINR